MSGGELNIDKYKYSSYNENIVSNGMLVDTEYILNMLSNEYFIEFHNEKNEDVCLV